MTTWAMSRAATAALLAFVLSCESESPEQGSQTNWLRSCATSADCDGLECHCGTCTVTCADEAECSDRGFGSCVASSDPGAVAVCDGQKPPSELCLPRCDGATCPSGTSCVAGVCAPALEPTAHVEVDPSSRHQALIGFGASLAYDEDVIVGHPDKAALFDAMFLESGFDVIRVRNRFESDNTSDLLPASEIIDEAAARLGRAPTVFITSGSPPAVLKANGDRFCSNSDPACTLARAADGGFDYAGFAEHWRASLEAYDGVGIHPDFVSIQNNPDWIPPDASAFEACRFLPEEGMATVPTPDGGSVDAEFPGYSDALASVTAAVGTLAGEYVFVAAEAGSAVMVAGYAPALDAPQVGALAFHLYGMDPAAIAIDQLEGVRGLGENTNQPVIQSEMSADGFSTAVLAHYTLTAAGASAYLQQPFVGSTTDEAPGNLIGIDGASVVQMPAYHALAHFARTTGPGWLRVDAASDVTDVLVSAWLSPDEASLTVVLVNTTDVPIDAEVNVVGSFATLLGQVEATRTVFDGVERSADLGRLPANRVVRVPGRSIVTVATSGS